MIELTKAAEMFGLAFGYGTRGHMMAALRPERVPLPENVRFHD